MGSLIRIIAVLSACGIVDGFVGPQTPPLHIGKCMSTVHHVPSPLVPRKSSRMHLFSDKELTDTPSPTISSTDTNGTNSIALKHDESKTVVAIRWTLAWMAAASMFGAGIFFFLGPDTMEEFFAGYLLELSLSVDNLLVFLLLFDYFKVPSDYQNRVLNYGIVGAVIMRAIMIGAGAVAIQQFHVVLLGFAGILLYSSFSVLSSGDADEEEDLSENVIVKFSNRFIQSTNEFDGDRFFTVENGVRVATPLLICTVAVELSDVVFAVDSIPAVFGVTENPLVVFSSNMFAILGLRSLYTILSKAAEDLEYLESSVAIVLGFIGSKMIAEYFGVEVPTEISLGVVLALLSGGVGLSVLKNTEKTDSET